MNPVSGPAIAAAALLVLAGLPKLRDPGATAGALRSVGWPAAPPLVRAGAAAETAIGVAAVVVGGRVAWALSAAAYAGFAAFLVVALRRGGAVSSCGCVGRPDTPPTAVHLGLSTALSAVTAAAAGLAAPGLTGLDWSRGAEVTVVAFSAIVAWLAWAVIAVLPGVLAVARPRRRRPAGATAPAGP